MRDSDEIVLAPASLYDAGLLANLIELYVHDLSEVFPIEIGPGGRFGYEALPRYWTEPDRRFPFLIQRAGCVVGFVLVTRGSPATDDPSDLDVAEFFILRRHRRGGLGRLAAQLLWDRMPGRWVVRVAHGNTTAVPFWRAVVHDYAGDAFEERRRPGTPHVWSDFVFRSRRAEVTA